MIAAGNGCTDDLQLEHLPANTDIRVGDVLVTSGLGGRFPEGYPVAVVSSVKLGHPACLHRDSGASNGRLAAFALPKFFF